MSESEFIQRNKEKQLIQRTKSGDRVAARELIDLHKNRLFAFIFRMSHNHHDAEEICQEAFLKAFASIDSFSSEYRFSTWLFTIGYRICLNQLRRKRPLTGDLDFSALPLIARDSSADSLVSQDVLRLRNAVWSAVDQLSPAQRSAILLFYRHELGCHEISRIMELPLATVKSHLHRARAKLRELMESMGEEQLSQFRNLGDSAG